MGAGSYHKDKKSGMGMDHMFSGMMGKMKGKKKMKKAKGKKKK
jgi:hypothetical protein